MNEYISERDLSKLRWRCRRGLLENDLLIERFFHQLDQTQGGQVTATQMIGLYELMDLSDNDLLDLLLGRVAPPADASSQFVQVLKELKS